MIHHLSISVRDPEHVARALAEFMGGSAVPFPPVPGGWFAFQDDDNGTGVEIYPAGTELRPDNASGADIFTSGSRELAYVPTHFALSVNTSPEAISAIAKREGWQCQLQERGGGNGFHVMEVWIENTVMVELLPPAFAAEYVKLHQMWKEFRKSNS